MNRIKMSIMSLQKAQSHHTVTVKTGRKARLGNRECTGGFDKKPIELRLCIRWNCGSIGVGAVRE